MTEATISGADIQPQVAMADPSRQDLSWADAQFPGLTADALYPWAMVDTEDGKRYGLFRALTPTAAVGFSVHDCSADRWTYPDVICSMARGDLYLGEIDWRQENGASVLVPRGAEAAGQHACTFEVAPDRLVWKEDDVVDVVLTPIPGNVTRIHMPGAPGDTGYTSAGYAVSGRVNGSRVIGGYGGIDRMYSDPANKGQPSKTAALEHYWVVWGALQADGSWHCGNVYLAADGLATATFNRPGQPPVIATREAVTSAVAWDGNGTTRLPCAATFAFAGLRFEWRPTHNAVFGGPELSFAHLYGTVEQVDGPAPVASWSTMEIIKSRATERHDL